MSNPRLGKEDSELFNAVENGAFESKLTDQRREELAQIARNTFKKDKRINIRISNRDLRAIQSKASKEGVPYQTLVSSIIQKYISGSLNDVSENCD